VMLYTAAIYLGERPGKEGHLPAVLSFAGVALQAGGGMLVLFAFWLAGRRR